MKATQSFIDKIFLQGTKQNRRRSVMCVDDQEMALPDSFCDSKSRPAEEERCKSLPECIWRKR